MLGQMLPRDMPYMGRRFDPVRQRERTQADLNRLFGGLRFYPLLELPLLNLWTNDEGAIVAAEVPGVAPEDIDVTIRRDTLTVRGTRSPAPVDDNTVMHRQERLHGNFTRTIVLPFRVDADKTSARFERGLVILTLPRPEDDKPRHIKVARS